MISETRDEIVNTKMNLIEEKQTNVIDVKHEVISDTKPVEAKASNQNLQQVQQMIEKIPSEHHPTAKNEHKQLIRLLTKYVKEKGVEFVKSSIEYTIEREPTVFVAYLTVVLKSDHTKNTNKKAKVNPKIAEAKKVAVQCFNNPTIGCPGTAWFSFKDDQTQPCHWCKKHERSRIDYENESKQQPTETVNVKPAETKQSVKPPPEVKPQPQQPVQEQPQMSEVELMMQKMQEQIQEMELRQQQKEQKLQQEIKQLKADKEKLEQFYKPQHDNNRNHHQPQRQTSNSNIGNINFPQFREPVQEAPVHQGLTREQNQIVGKWFMMQDDIKKHPILKNVYDSYNIGGLKVDIENSTINKIVLFSDSKIHYNHLTRSNSRVMTIIQEVAGEELEITLR